MKIKMEWISIKEKLPDNLCYQIVAWNIEGTCGTTIAMCEIYKDKKWYYHHNNFPIQLNNITHWMPFPDPPVN